MNFFIDTISEEDLSQIIELTKRSLKDKNVKEWSYSGGYNATNILLPLSSNKQLINILNSYTGYEHKNITSLHYINYPVGTSLQRHRDKEMLHIKNPPKSNTVIFMLSMCEQGGELLVEDVVTPFNTPGQYISFDGESLFHEVKEIKEGNRETLVLWYKPKSSFKAI